MIITVIVFAWIFGWFLLGVILTLPMRTILYRANERYSDSLGYTIFALAWPLTVMYMTAYFLMGRAAPAKAARKAERIRLETERFKEAERIIAEFSMTPLERDAIAEQKKAEALERIARADREIMSRYRRD